MYAPVTDAALETARLRFWGLHGSAAARQLPAPAITHTSQQPQGVATARVCRENVTVSATAFCARRLGPAAPAVGTLAAHSAPPPRRRAGALRELVAPAQRARPGPGHATAAATRLRHFERAVFESRAPAAPHKRAAALGPSSQRAFPALLSLKRRAHKHTQPRHNNHLAASTS